MNSKLIFYQQSQNAKDFIIIEYQITLKEHHPLIGIIYSYTMHSSNCQIPLCFRKYNCFEKDALFMLYFKTKNYQCYKIKIIQALILFFSLSRETLLPEKPLC